MNIFVLASSPEKAAEAHCDKHVVKMILEYAQLLSTAHRVFDGIDTEVTGKHGKSKTVRLLDGEHATSHPDKGFIIENANAYLMTHSNHPSAVWTRQSSDNYQWLVQLWAGLMREYTYRYGKQHSTARLFTFLSKTPNNLPVGNLTPFAQAMPEERKVPDDACQAYRNFYVEDKARFARWTRRPPPDWFVRRTGASLSSIYRPSSLCSYKTTST